MTEVKEFLKFTVVLLASFWVARRLVDLISRTNTKLTKRNIAAGLRSHLLGDAGLEIDKAITIQHALDFLGLATCVGVINREITLSGDRDDLETAEKFLAEVVALKKVVGPRDHDPKQITDIIEQIIDRYLPLPDNPTT